MARSTWVTWCDDFDRVERELYGALHTRWMWRTLNALVNRTVVKPDPVLVGYFNRTYAATVCTFVRRQASTGKDDIGLTRCLMTLRSQPSLATRELHIQRGNERHGRDDWDESNSFAVFTPGGGPAIERHVVDANLVRLKDAATPVKKYVDAAVAHTGRSDFGEPIAVTFAQIDHALDEIEAVLQIFYGLRNPGTHLAFATPVASLEFLTMFEMPWFPEGSTLHADLDFPQRNARWH